MMAQNNYLELLEKLGSSKPGTPTKELFGGIPDRWIDAVEFYGAALQKIAFKERNRRIAERKELDAKLGRKPRETHQLWEDEPCGKSKLKRIKTGYVIERKKKTKVTNQQHYNPRQLANN